MIDIFNINFCFINILLIILFSNITKNITNLKMILKSI